MGTHATELDEYIAALPVRPRLGELTPDQVRVLRRRSAYAGARADLERARAEVWARLVARGLTVPLR